MFYDQPMAYQVLGRDIKLQVQDRSPEYNVTGRHSSNYRDCTMQLIDV